LAAPTLSLRIQRIEDARGVMAFVAIELAISFLNRGALDEPDTAIM
jgi:hypothetical protein